MKQQGIREILRAARPRTARVFLPRERRKNWPQLVSVNGERYAIERGQDVEVPYVVAQVLWQSAASDEAVARRVAALEDSPAVMTLS